MKVRKFSAVCMALLMVAGLLLPGDALASAKRRIAIMPFEYGAVSSEVGTVDVGKGITSMLITHLVNDGTYSVVERQMLDAILKEQNFSNSDRADATTAAKIGKLLGVDAIVVGTVTHFGFERSSVNVGAAASAATAYIPYVGGLGGFGGLRVKKGKCKVAVDARLVDINTGEILSAMQGSGESKRSGTSLFGGSGWSGGSFDAGSEGFATTIAGEATSGAVKAIADQLVAVAARIPDNQSLAAQNVEGKIADVSGSTVVVNVGKNNGVAAGDHLQAERPYKTIKDPTTGKILKELTATIGIIRIDSVDPESATGTITRGEGLKVGDNVRKVTTDVSAVVLQPAPAGDGTAQQKTAQ